MADKMNIVFKRGLQNNLNTIINSGKSEAGCFYLTTDTNRLYVGQDANKAPVLLNQTVQIVNNVASLPVIGSTNGPAINDFYYCTQENILAVYTGGTQWKQINANTDHNTFVSDAIATVTKDADSIDVSVELKRVNKDHTTLIEEDAESVEFGFSLTKTDFIDLLKTNVGLDVVAITGGGATISTTGDGANTANKVNIKAKDESVKIAVSNDDITVQGTTYDLQATNDNIILHNNLNNNSDNKIALEDDDVVLLTSVNNTITAEHTAIQPEYEFSKRTLTSDGQGKFIALIDVEDDGHGHITKYITEEVTLPEYVNNINKEISIDVNEDSKLTMSIKDSQNNILTATSKKALYYTVNGSTYYNQSELPVYTKNEIDNKFNTIDALTYKGTIGSAGATVSSLPTTGVKIGDTYKVAASGNYGGHVCDIGDLLIATGTENNGVISSGLTWTYIPSGDDTDTQYALSAAENKVKLTTTNGGNEVTTVEFTSPDESIDITTLTGNKITLEHADVTCTRDSENQTLSNEGTFNIIKNIEVNDQGHVTKVTTSAVTLPKDNNTVYDISTIAGTLNKSAKIQLNGSDNSADSITLQNTDEYINVNSAGEDAITVNHKSYGTLSATSQTAQTLGYDGSFTVVTGVSRDTGGHISGYTTKQFTLPGDTNETFEMSGATVSVANNAATFTTSLKGSKNTNSSSAIVVKSASTNIEVTASGSNGASIDLVWGTF